MEGNVTKRLESVIALWDTLGNRVTYVSHPTTLVNKRKSLEKSVLTLNYDLLSILYLLY